LWEKQKGAMRLVAVDFHAASLGLTIQQNLSDARAQVPNLEAREIDRAYLEHVFGEFADWHSNASPIVSVLRHRSPYGDLCLDITGVSHLFGGEHQMLALLTKRLQALGYSVSGAIAGSIGAAWALARFAPGHIFKGDDPSGILAPLPVAALRIDEEQVDGLGQMGLKSIGDLFARNRKSLSSRFGFSLIERLDQALGLLEETLEPRLPEVDRYAERRFAEPIGLIDDVLMTAHDLAVQLSMRLEAEGLGAQGFHLFLYRVDHKVMTLSVNAARATRDPEHIARLFTNRTERLMSEYDAGFGIDMIRLAASSVSPVASLQVGAFDAHDGTVDLDRLYDRIVSRIGPLGVVRNKLLNSHIPERSAKLEPVIARTPDDPDDGDPVGTARPLRLLPTPEPIQVTADVPDGPPASMIWRHVSYRFVKASGPERIGVEWWSPLDGAALTRDYYIAEDGGGRRYWMFRAGLYGEAALPGWFLHGLFV
jgi:protein ImuB